MQLGILAARWTSLPSHDYKAALYMHQTIRVGYLGINLFGNVFSLLYCHLMFDLSTNMLQLLVKRCCKLVATGQLILKVTASKFK